MTAIPIVETQAGDISAYIPTNIISITDGQIYLKVTCSFRSTSGYQYWLSVSRVGGDAQSKAMKSAVGTLRLSWHSTMRWKYSCSSLVIWTR